MNSNHKNLFLNQFNSDQIKPFPVFNDSRHILANRNILLYMQQNGSTDEMVMKLTASNLHIIADCSDSQSCLFKRKRNLKLNKWTQKHRDTNPEVIIV